MKLEIIKEAKQGFAPTLTVYVDGEKSDFCHELSRSLTNTDNESRSGIFSSGECSFFRTKSECVVYFPEFDFSENNTPSAILAEIRERVNQVNAAFLDKYPDVYQVAEWEF